MSHFDPLRTTDGDCPECGTHVTTHCAICYHELEASDHLCHHCAHTEVERLACELEEANRKYEQAMYCLRDGLGVGEFQDINSVGRWKQRVLDAFPELLE